MICKLAPPPAASTSPVWPVLVGTLSTVFDSIMVDAAPRQSVRKSTLVLTRRTVRNAHGYIPSLISTLVGATGSGGLRAVAFLGLVLDVAVRLRVGKETGKGMADGVGRGYVREAKEKILQFFTSQILSSKTPVPPHVTKALNDFVATEVTDEDVTKTVRPQMEKMLLRSPEVALPIVADFFSAFGTSPSAKGDAPGSSADLSAHVQPLLPSITSASRSTNAATRSKTCALFSVLIARVQSDTVRAISDELLNLLKSGKTSSPEQRAALFAMLASCPAGSSVSPVIADSLAAILPKETNEASLAAALNALAVHEAWCLNSDQALSPSVPKALVKGLQEAKAPLRKAACLAVGTLLWNINHTGASDTTTESLRTLGEALLPGLETNLKNAAANPLTNPAGPLEGYIAVALLEGRMTGWGSKSIGELLNILHIVSSVYQFKR